jgi:hypothetical protein
MVIEVGAFKDDRTEIFKNISPSSEVLMIEARASKKPVLLVMTFVLLYAVHSAVRYCKQVYYLSKRGIH